MPVRIDIPNETEYSCEKEIGCSQGFSKPRVSERSTGRDAILEFVELKDLLKISGQKDFKTFDDVFIEKDALKAFKVIPFRDNYVNGSDVKVPAIASIYNEIVCASKLSKFRGSQNFPKVHNIHLIKGACPQYLCDVYDQYHERCCLIKHFDLDRFPPDQCWIIIESEMYGRSLNAIPPTCPMAALSVFAQTVLAVAVTETRFRFEHRDLHGGNILLQYDAKDACSQRIPSTYFQGQTLRPRNGPLAKIIDFTLSRITDRDTAIYTNVSSYRNLFIGNTRSHAHLYREMRDLLKDDWSAFNPRNNAKWIHHIGERIREIVEKGKYCNYHKNSNAGLIRKQFRELLNKAMTASSAANYAREISTSKILFRA
ncbi:unnamed protein product [Rodentolepis nana]|uniref:non-specific serine/threonine protein kinase n=1 Tax=Rodentolepis nana TaxID=102285 RepID=A0A0R3TU47_RODNA|nr:unnamed protein product [Rodentolepis nana]